MTDKERDFVLSIIKPDRRSRLDWEFEEIKKAREVSQTEMDIVFVREAYLEKFGKHFPYEYVQDMDMSEAEKIILQCIMDGKEYEIPKEFKEPGVIIA